MRSKNYIDIIFFFFWELYRIEFIFFIISRIKGKCEWKIISILFFLRAIQNRISFLIISRVEDKCDRKIISILFFSRATQNSIFLFLSFRGSYYLTFFESYIEFIFLSFRGWKVNAIEELYQFYLIFF